MVVFELQEVKLQAQLEDQVVTGSSERAETRIELKQDYAHAPYVRCFRGWLVASALWRHVLRGANKVNVLRSFVVIIDESFSKLWLQQIVR